MQVFWERICAWNNAGASILLGLFRKRHALAWLVTALAVLPILLLTLALNEGQAAAREFQAVPLYAADLSGSQRRAGQVDAKTTETKRTATAQAARMRAYAQARMAFAARLAAAGILTLPLSFLTSVFLMRRLCASQRRERRLSALLDAAPEPLALADPHGRPFYGNPAFRRLHGLNQGMVCRTGRLGTSGRPPPGPPFCATACGRGNGTSRMPAGRWRRSRRR